jgi:hypothetical protein
MKEVLEKIDNEANERETRVRFKYMDYDFISRSDCELWEGE